LPLLGFLKGIFWFDVFARGLVRELDQDLEIKSWARETGKTRSVFD